MCGHFVNLLLLYFIEKTFQDSQDFKLQLHPLLGIPTRCESTLIINKTFGLIEFIINVAHQSIGREKSGSLCDFGDHLKHPKWSFLKIM